jgi:hypothetical protein
MAALTSYASNKLTDALWRAQAIGTPATWYFAIIIANRGTWAASTAYALNDYVVTASPTNNRLYKCTTAGTSGASAPTWPTTEGGTVSDGTVTWTEQTTAMNAGTFTEASYTGYARVGVTAGLTEFAGTQGAGTTVASSGTSGQTSNNASIVFGLPTSTQTGLAVGIAVFDASTGGNCWEFEISNTPLQILNGASAPTIAAAGWTSTFTP